ncbi:MAG: glycosyltransferase family 4 protein [Bacteroidales bacterium]|jgi:glycosyltransferase involved in cell wall biosynthesis|nr:glycosyltransferase family 4 protein [Bacteroidales bacterium]
MIIAINARTLRAVPRDGIGWFTLEVVRGMVRNHPEHRFVMISDRKYSEMPVDTVSREERLTKAAGRKDLRLTEDADRKDRGVTEAAGRKDQSLTEAAGRKDRGFPLEGSNVEYVTIPLRTVHPVLWHFWHEYLLPPVLKRTGADVFIAPDGMIPLRTDVPCIPVIHDLNHEHRPGDIPRVECRYYRRRFPLFAGKGARVATVSHFSADDIASTYGIDPAKIDVVPNGVAESFSPPLAGEVEETRKQYTGGRPYFLFVSNFSPRKNVEAVIRAFEQFRKAGHGDHVLLLAGRRLYLTKEMDRHLEASPYGNDILFTGSVTRDVLRRLYGAAEALTFVPWLEGFGIPVVEAQRCGTPCILSDGSSLPEVSGGAALCVSPADAGAIAEAMARLVTDGALRRRLATEGLANSMRYTWEGAAEAMWQSVLKATRK